MTRYDDKDGMASSLGARAASPEGLLLTALHPSGPGCAGHLRMTGYDGKDGMASS
jgi:hypothetical protein